MRNQSIGLIVLFLLFLVGCGEHNGGPPPAEPPPLGEVWFEDTAQSAGIDFCHFDPATDQHLISETIGSGLGWIDYDADGWPDLFCVQDGPLPPATADPARTHKLYRNNRNGTFTDVTNAVGLNEAGFGLGCAVGDYDNDGFDDLLVTYLGGIELFHNEPDAQAPGGRRFRNVTAGSGLTNPHYGNSCAWGDLDGDGRLDLYVCNYVEIDPAHPITCKHPEHKVYYPCHPSAYSFAAHRLFRNEGNGRFTDVSVSSGIAGVQAGPGLGVLIVDLDADGRPDIYVVNDMSEALLFHNLGGMKFAERALRSGVALGPGGQRMAGMGIAAGDFDGSGRPSLFVTNYQSTPNAFYLNRGKLNFDESSDRAGLAGPSLSKLRFGAAALDANLDGSLDLVTTSGHVFRHAKEYYGIPYAQECQLFLGSGRGQFRDASAGSGPDFLRPRVGRGLAVCDFDNDGRPDLAISGVGEPVALLHNRSTSTNHWLSLQLEGDGKTSNRDAIGAVVEATIAGKKHTYFVFGGGSYLSASDRRVHLGLGEALQIDRATIRWPSGQVQEINSLPGDARWKLTEGRPPKRIEP